eukprot:Tamp_23907.p2 GENE.Tamp_23907~~Tamp_23907.p2  ORF type:complete len:110 (+),score=4.36 Tamp_23907:681-1010(+)
MSAWTLSLPRASRSFRDAVFTSLYLYYSVSLLLCVFTTLCLYYARYERSETHTRFSEKIHHLHLASSGCAAYDNAGAQQHGDVSLLPCTFLHIPQRRITLKTSPHHLRE